MKKVFFTIFISASLTWVGAVTASPSSAKDAVPIAPATTVELTEDQKIEALIQHLEHLEDATFIRNGRKYKNKVVGRFLRGKWRKMGKDVRTADQFITQIASQSSTTGRLYKIRLAGGTEIPCGDYLRERLTKMNGGKQAKGTR